MSALGSSRICLNYFTKVNTTRFAGYCQKAVASNEDEASKPIFLDDDAERETKYVRRDRSGLLVQDRNKLHGKMPYSEPHSWIHLTEKYQRKMYGKFGNESGVDPRICFPSKSELKFRAEYDALAEPHTLLEMMQKVRLEKEKKQAEILKREEDIAKKIEKLDQWKNELNAKIAKKEADTLAAKERKERLIEEVRRHFGFKVDPRDDRFKEMLEQKEREDKKKQKEAKRKAKEEKMIAKLIEKNVSGKDSKDAKDKSETTNVDDDGKK